MYVQIQGVHVSHGVESVLFVALSFACPFLSLSYLVSFFTPITVHRWYITACALQQALFAHRSAKPGQPICHAKPVVYRSIRKPFIVRVCKIDLLQRKNHEQMAEECQCARIGTCQHAAQYCSTFCSPAKLRNALFWVEDF